MAEAVNSETSETSATATLEIKTIIKDETALNKLLKEMKGKSPSEGLLKRFPYIRKNPCIKRVMVAVHELEYKIKKLSKCGCTFCKYHVEMMLDKKYDNDNDPPTTLDTTPGNTTDTTPKKNPDKIPVKAPDSAQTMTSDESSVLRPETPPGRPRAKSSGTRSAKSTGTRSAKSSGTQPAKSSGTPPAEFTGTPPSTSQVTSQATPPVCEAANVVFLLYCINCDEVLLGFTSEMFKFLPDLSFGFHINEKCKQGKSHEKKYVRCMRIDQQRSSEDKINQEKSAGDKTIEQKSAGDKNVKQKSAGDKTIEQKSAGDKTIKQKSAGDKTVEKKSSKDKNNQNKIMSCIKDQNNNQVLIGILKNGEVFHFSSIQSDTVLDDIKNKLSHWDKYLQQKTYLIVKKYDESYAAEEEEYSSTPITELDNWGLFRVYHHIPSSNIKGLGTRARTFSYKSETIIYLKICFNCNVKYVGRADKSFLDRYESVLSPNKCTPSVLQHFKCENECTVRDYRWTVLDGLNDDQIYLLEKWRYVFNKCEIDVQKKIWKMMNCAVNSLNKDLLKNVCRNDSIEEILKRIKEMEQLKLCLQNETMNKELERKLEHLNESNDDVETFLRSENENWIKKTKVLFIEEKEDYWMTELQTRENGLNVNRSSKSKDNCPHLYNEFFFNLTNYCISTTFNEA